MLLPLSLLLAAVPLVSAAVYDKCPDDESTFSGPAECKFFYNNNWITVGDDTDSPFGTKCQSYDVCKKEDGVIPGGILQGNGNRYWVACNECAEGYSTTKRAASPGEGTCKSSLTFQDNCYLTPTYTDADFTTCPNDEWRVNKCKYMVDSSWVEVAEDVANPYGESCAALALCSAQQPSWPTNDVTPADNVFFVMCELCAEGYYGAQTNNALAGSCGVGTKYTKCLPGTKPVDPTPDPTPDSPTPVAPTPTPAPEESFLDKSTITVIIGGVVGVLLIVMGLVIYILRGNRRRTKKKVERTKQEMKEKAKAEKEKEKLMEMGRILHTQASELSKNPTGGLSEEEKAERKAKRKAEKEKVRKALDDGLPEGWRSFTDKATGGVYYCHLETGETTWTRPVMETVIEREVQLMGTNPMRSDVEQQNDMLKEQMKKLVENNRMLKKEAVNAATSGSQKLHTIDSAKRKKAIGTFKKAVAGVQLANRGSTPEGKLAASVEAMQAQATIDSATAEFPAPPPGGAAAAAAGASKSIRGLVKPSVGLPPPGPKPGESSRSFAFQESSNLSASENSEEKS